MTTILMVEDEEQIRVLAESILRDAGYTVIAATGVEGSHALLESDQSIELLFIDLNLANDQEAGLRVAQSARETRSKLPVLYTSGLGVNEGMKVLFVEPFHFLPKPYTAAQLTKSVEYLLLKSKDRKPLKFPDSEPPISN